MITLQFDPWLWVVWLLTGVSDSPWVTTSHSLTPQSSLLPGVEPWHPGIFRCFRSLCFATFWMMVGGRPSFLPRVGKLGKSESILTVKNTWSSWGSYYLQKKTMFETLLDAIMVTKILEKACGRCVPPVRVSQVRSTIILDDIVQSTLELENSCKPQEMMSALQTTWKKHWVFFIK